MLEEIHFPGSVRTPFGSFRRCLVRRARQSAGGAVRREAAGRQELLVGNILGGAHRANAARQILIGAGLRRRRNGQSQWAS